MELAEQKKNAAEQATLLAELVKQLKAVQGRLDEHQSRFVMGDWRRHFLHNRVLVLEGQEQEPPLRWDEVYPPEPPAVVAEDEEEPDVDSEAADKDVADEQQPDA